MDKRVFIIILCCFLPEVNARAEGNDSLVWHDLTEVTIVQPRSTYYSDASKVKVLPESTFYATSYQNLGELLSSSIPVFIKTYGGSGNLSTISFRGTNADHTQVNWNGFPLNSVTTGDVDFSLIPVAIADRIAITYGAGGSLYGSGTFGGSIDLSSYSDIPQKLNATITSQVGSFGSRFGEGDIRYSGNRFSFRSMTFYRSADNDFPYKDIYKYGSPRSVEKHNELRAFGTIQQVGIDLQHSQRLEAGIWYQSKRKNIPEIMGSYGSSLANQRDSSFKAFLKYSKAFSHSSVVVKSAYFFDYLRYTDKENPTDETASVFSEFLTRQYYTDIDYRRLWGTRWSTDAGFVSDFIHTDVKNYGKEVSEYRWALFGAGKYSLPGLSVNASLRAEVQPNGKPVLLPSVGIRKELWKDWLYVRSSFSRKFRQPTFNEKYWQPGGNIHIKPETGWGAECAMGSHITEPSGQDLSAEITAYSTLVNDWIQWTGSGTLWSPVNFKKVWARGLEVSFTYGHTAGPLKWNSSLNYSYTRSTSMEVYDGSSDIIGKQIRYIPVNTANWITRAEWKVLNGGFSFSYTGKRFITEDHSGKALEAFLLTNVWTGIHIGWKYLEGNISARIDNLLGVSYQLIGGYPMPGRFFSLNLQLGFKK